MKPSPSPADAVGANAVDPASQAGSRRRDPVQRVMPARVAGLSCLAILAGATVLSALAIFPVSLVLVAAVEALRCAISPGPAALGARLAADVVPVMKVSVGTALIVALLACAAFLADLRRQRWL